VAFHGVDHTAVAPSRHRDHARSATARLLARGCAEFAALHEHEATQWHVRELSTWRRLRIPALSHRPGSPLSGTAAQALWRVGQHRLDHGRATRLALHPRDLDDPRLVATTLALLDHAVALGSRFTTYTKLVQRWVSRTPVAATV
jgi:hypothetical protein